MKKRKTNIILNEKDSQLISGGREGGRGRGGGRGFNKLRQGRKKIQKSISLPGLVLRT